MVLRLIQCLIAAITFAGLCNATAAERHITEGRNFNVIVETTNFDPKNHRMEYRTHEGQRALLKIDGAEYSGSDGEVPSAEITSISAITDGRIYRLPRSSFRSLFNPRLGSDSSAYVTNKQKSIEISFRGGDGAGSYGVSFLIDKGSAKVERRVTEYPAPDRPKLRTFLATTEPNRTVERDAQASGARPSP